MTSLRRHGLQTRPCEIRSGTERAYVELRDEDEDGGDVLVVAIFSYRTTSRLSKAQIEQDIVRKARHMMKRAAGAI
jgi:hypothetical protein